MQNQNNYYLKAYGLTVIATRNIVFPIAKKKGRVLNHKMGHCKCMKGAIFSEKGHFRFAIKQIELFKLNNFK